MLGIGVDFGTDSDAPEAQATTIGQRFSNQSDRIATGREAGRGPRPYLG
ncbi:MAG: hypothetical protein OXO56_13245 [Gammaproteobacteria bacterium]|nr:hypothetical protein [Gammaproteobacteria bacterium]